ncbi:MAG TPA: matrixin family metalloprotease [Thermoanaerobaculia bacterium]|nr:matrixin family metalloprotease [Thermoanaerobaculia bacterium]
MSASRTGILAVLALAAVPAFAGVRLTYQVNGNPVPVAWPNGAFPLRYAVDRKVANAFPAGLIDRAFKEWTDVDDARVTFQPLGVINTQPGKDGQNSVTFVDDLFKGQNFLALTTNWYDDSGHIIEGDIQIDPSVVPNRFNLQLLVEHEVGHLLGLDHSAVLSSVMYPFVGRGGSASLDSDDIVAIASLYPKTDPMSTGATLSGRVTGDNGGIYAAQVVALNDDGEPVATALTDQRGDFEIDGVPPGTYRLYAEPLDGPVEVRNLSGSWQTAKTYSFPTEFFGGGPLRIQTGRVYGNLVLNSAGSIKLNPKFIGAMAPGTNNLSLDATPLILTAGQTIAIAVAGDGFLGGVTTFEIPNQSFRRVSDFSYAGNYVYATFTIAPDVTPGSVSVLVKNGNEMAALTGALRVTNPQRTRVVRR